MAKKTQKRHQNRNRARARQRDEQDDRERQRQYEERQNACHLDNLHRDTIACLIDHLDPVSAVCFALTSHKFHDAVVKTKKMGLKDICPTATQHSMSPKYAAWKSSDDTFKSLMRTLTPWFPKKYSYCGNKGRKWVLSICHDAGTGKCGCLLPMSKRTMDAIDIQSGSAEREDYRIDARRAAIASCGDQIKSTLEGITMAQRSSEASFTMLSSLLVRQVEDLQVLAFEGVQREAALLGAYVKYDETVQNDLRRYSGMLGRMLRDTERLMNSRTPVATSEN